MVFCLKIQHGRMFNGFFFLSRKEKKVKPLEPGMTGSFSIVVDERHLAHTYGNKGVKVLATPALTWMFEAAASDVIFPALDEGEISVGTWISVKHLKPTPPGLNVTCIATLKTIEGRKYLFDVVVRDDVEVVAVGNIERATIDKDRFYRELDEKIRPVHA